MIWRNSRIDQWSDPDPYNTMYPSVVTDDSLRHYPCRLLTPLTLTGSAAVASNLTHLEKEVMSDANKISQILLTPGPLTTSVTVKHSMQRDWGSRDNAFTDMTARIRRRLVALANGDPDHVCVPVQGSGTFAVEATLGTLLSRQTSKLLILINGAYGRRMARICEKLGQPFDIYETAENTPPDAAHLAKLLQHDGSLSHVAVVHCETTSGILNPLAEIADVVAGENKRLILVAGQVTKKGACTRVSYG